MKQFLILLILSFVAFQSQVGSTNAFFGTRKDISANSVSTKCWAVPVAPMLSAPANDAAITLTDVPFFWSAGSSECSIATLSYKLQVFSDVSLTTLISESPWIPGTAFTVDSMTEGHFYWKVLVQDQFGNATSSSAWHLIIDRTSPSNVSLSVANSWTKAVSETIQNGNFDLGDLTNWTKAGNVSVVSTDTLTNPAGVITPYDSSAYMAVIGNSEDSGNFVWENRLMQSFASGAKSLSLNYNFFSRDSSPFDTPGFFIRLNGEQIFSQNNLESIDDSYLSTGWQQLTYDLSDITGPTLNLALYAGNTNDTGKQSWVYVNKITTYFVTAPAAATYTLTAVDSLSGINHFEYQIDGGGWQSGATFTIPTGGSHTLEYRAVDNAGNTSAIHVVKIVTDITAPSAISDLTAVATSPNSVLLSFTAPGNDGGSGRAAKYDVRYSTTPITNDTDFNGATAVSNPLTPHESGILESLEITGLNPSTLYYFAVKAADEAPNWATLSNSASDTTLAGGFINPGDVVINELYWSGSALSPSDQFLELRNMTGRTITFDATSKLTKFDGSSQIDMGIDLTGKTIAPYGYFLIADSNPMGSSHLKDSLTPNVIDANLDLSTVALKVELLHNATTVDTAWNESTPSEGLNDGTHFYSMERTHVPGDGTNPLTWYTCIDSASTADFFDTTSDERGTPGAVNRSENEPPRKISQGIRENMATPSASLTLSSDKSEVTIKVKDINGFTKLSYLLTYDTDSISDGTQGQVQLLGANNFSKSLILGTCSTTNCTYHQGVKNFHLTVTLTDVNNNNKQLTVDLP